MLSNYRRFYRAFDLDRNRHLYFNCYGRYVSSFHFDYERIKGTENSKWLRLTGKQAIERFIPITQKALFKMILEDKDLVKTSCHKNIQQIATEIDLRLYVQYKGELNALKSLYNPLSPDRDTIQMKKFSPIQLIEREKDILKKLSSLAYQAGFYELPRDIIAEALEEDNLSERMIMVVSPEDYMTLKFWVIGMDVIPLDDEPWRAIIEKSTMFINSTLSFLDPLTQRLQERTFMAEIALRVLKKLYGENITRIARYKRVIVAVRREKDAKLLIKGFKDIPCGSLEFLLPAGKIKMKTLDQIKLIIQSSFVLLFVLWTTNLTETAMETSLIAALLVAIILIRNAAIYKSYRNRCVLNLSQTLYFKSIANNHALLALIIDRAKDEICKLMLLCYVILSRRRCTIDEICCDDTGLTESELKTEIENWLKKRLDIKVNLSINTPLNYLRDMELVHSRFGPKGIIYHSIHLKEAKVLPSQFEKLPLLHQDDLLAINIKRTWSEKTMSYPGHEGQYDWK